MLSIQNLSIRAGLKPLLESANFALHPGQKVGIIGQNGVGKTSFFRAILGELSIDAGQLAMPANWVVGCVEQEVHIVQQSVLKFVSYGDSHYAKIDEKIKRCNATEDHEGLVQAYDEMDKINGFSVEPQAKQLLYGLGFEDCDLDKSIDEFSGGWQVRLKLARALMQRSDLLLLDEPTNHLDIEAVTWLEQWLKSYSGAILVISHDRDFLDQVVGGIAHIHQQKIHYYSGNFAAFERQRNEQLMQQQALHEKQKQQMQHLKSFIARFKAKASKAKQAQSRVKALERIEQVAAVQATNPFTFKFFEPKQQPDPMMEINNIDFAYGERSILSSVELVLRKGDRIGLVGVNGSGKTTLLKVLVGDLPPQSGKVVLSKGVKVGYFAQHQLDSLEFTQSPLQHLLALAEKPSDQEARDFLGQFGFSNDQCLESIKTFSGGEKARLALAIIIFQKPNLIILDEPTNHLDMETRDALDMAIQEFTGAIILVTHDKHLLASIADQFWWVHKGQVTHLHGGLETYLQQRLKAVNELQNQGAKDKAVVSKKQLRQQSALSRKQLEAKLRPYQKELTKVEEALSVQQVLLEELHQTMEDESLYEAENKQKLAEIIQQESHCANEIEVLETRWLELEEEIDSIKGQNG